MLERTWSWEIFGIHQNPYSSTLNTWKRDAGKDIRRGDGRLLKGGKSERLVYIIGFDTLAVEAIEKKRTICHQFLSGIRLLGQGELNNVV